ncbi:MAG: hypothetical protein K0S45_2056 [Nitrospira sp.]|jgi:hypothetical protein|nr:hypothetical protein [Nitrospira sp.]
MGEETGSLDMPSQSHTIKNGMNRTRRHNLSFRMSRQYMEGPQ